MSTPVQVWRYQLTSVGLVIAAIGLRLALAPLAAHPGDLPVLARWAETISTQGLINIYRVSDANYPPLGMALIGAMGHLYRLLAPGAAFDPGSGLLVTLLKLPAILADGALLALIAWLGRAHRRRALWLALSVALNPALLLMSAYWGQLDSVYCALALACLTAARAESRSSPTAAPPSSRAPSR